MYRNIIITLLLLFAAAQAYAQVTLGDVLRSVEANNITLQAARSTVDARSLEARTGNSLDDLSVSYDYLWGTPRELGKTGELNISQSFDFPTVYAQRNRLAGNIARQAENEYLDTRQRILLEAKELYIELKALFHTEKLMRFRLNSNAYLQKVYGEKLESGDATLIEKTKFDHESLLLHESMAECRLRKIEVENRLRTLNGGVELDISEECDMPLEELRPYDDALADYETLAPQLLTYKLLEEGSEYDLRLSRQQSIPKFELGYKHEYGTAEGDRFNGVTVGLSIPIFSNRNNVKRAKAVQAAARLEAQAAAIECASLLSELYRKAELLEKSLERYEDLPEMKDYYALLVKALDAGEINVVEYFSEVSSYYDVLDARCRIEKEYRITTARINMIYL